MDKTLELYIGKRFEKTKLCFYYSKITLSNNYIHAHMQSDAETCDRRLHYCN